MTYDLRVESWIPWQRRSGAIEYGAPSAICSNYLEDPVVAIAAPRLDFSAATTEFLVGLLGLALQVDEDGWYRYWSEPPSSDALHAALMSLPDAFRLDGDGARFFQDYPAADMESQEPSPIDQIFIDAAGDQTIRQNKDLFVKRNRALRLSRPTAAMALITLQTYSPAGGRGTRTSLRGGGPLTTLVDPSADFSTGNDRQSSGTFWQKVWANVETADDAASRSPTAGFNMPHDVFPWLRPTRSSDKAGAELTPANANPWQAYFGMPRRIRLEFDSEGQCDITGLRDEFTVTGFRSRPYGTQYSAWQHPLSPYYEGKDKELISVHGQPGGVAWRDWLGLTLGTPDGKRRPAATVSRFAKRSKRIGLREVRIHVFGYDMDNAKARGWTESLQPIFIEGIQGISLAEHLSDIAGRLTEAASIAASMLHGSVKRSLFQGVGDAAGDIPAVKAELWQSSESEFFRALRAVSASTTPDITKAECCTQFARSLEDAVAEIFDRWCPGDSELPAIQRRVVNERYLLIRTMRGNGSLGKKMFVALGLAAVKASGKPAAVKKTGSRRKAQ